MMGLDLGGREAGKVFDGDGGCYYSWSSSEFPLLGDAKLGGGKLVLEPLALALPHYADSSKIGYVIQGTGRVGIILPKASEEVVLKLKKGDAVPVPLGAVSWWYNDGNSQLILVFLGDTSKAHHPGEFTYFFLTGANGIFTGFSTEFVSRAWNLEDEEEEANKLVKSQAGVLLIKLKEGQNMPDPTNADVQEMMIFNIKAAVPDVEVKNGGSIVVMTSAKLHLLREIGLSAEFVKLDANAMYSPRYSSDSAFLMTYIVQGSGRVQIVGIDGQCALDATLKAGQMFVVPRFFVVSKIAGCEGMEWFSIITTQLPVFNQLAGRASVWKALSPQVLQASLNVTLELEELFTLKMSDNSMFFPPRAKLG